MHPPVQGANDTVLSWHPKKAVLAVVRACSCQLRAAPGPAGVLLLPCS